MRIFVLGKFWTDASWEPKGRIGTSKKTGSEPARLNRTPRVRVTQIVLDYLAYGWSIDEMCRQHAYLSPAEAHAAMAYYFDHQEEIDEEIRNEFQASNEDRKAAVNSPFAARLLAQGKL